MNIENLKSLVIFTAYLLLDRSYAEMNFVQVALLNGITMGGGAGISIPGTFRVATDKTVCNIETFVNEYMINFLLNPALFSFLSILMKCEIVFMIPEFTIDVFVIWKLGFVIRELGLIVREIWFWTCLGLGCLRTSPFSILD